MKRLKSIPRDDFEVVFAEHWKPVELRGDAMPCFAQSVPESKLCQVLASGEYAASGEHYPCKRLRDAQLVGGIDVWRHAPDDPVDYNKDWYAVLSSSSTPEILYVDGPRKDAEHWSTKIPDRYLNVKVIC